MNRATCRHFLLSLGYRVSRDIQEGCRTRGSADADDATAINDRLIECYHSAHPDHSFDCSATSHPTDPAPVSVTPIHISHSSPGRTLPYRFLSHGGYLRNYRHREYYHSRIKSVLKRAVKKARAYVAVFDAGATRNKQWDLPIRVYHTDN